MKTIQVRHVSDEVHRRLKVSAAERGVSLTELLLPELEAIAMMPTLAEMQARLQARAPVEPNTPIATLIQEERDRAPARS